jgi:hypothetical protein
VKNNSNEPGLLPAGRAGRWWVLLLAVLLAVGVGIAHLIQWQRGLRGHELLQFFTIYLAVPLAAAMLLLFAYLRQPPRR